MHRFFHITLVVLAAVAACSGGGGGDSAEAAPGTPPAGDGTAFSFLAYGDSRAGGGCDGNAIHINLVTKMAAETSAAFVFNTGDMITGRLPEP